MGEDVGNGAPEALFNILSEKWDVTIADVDDILLRLAAEGYVIDMIESINEESNGTVD